MTQIIIETEFSEPVIFRKYVNDYKTCPYCGQDEIPFKKGVCKCGKQVGPIKYVKDPQKFARGNYFLKKL